MTIASNLLPLSMSNLASTNFSLTVPDHLFGKRLDQILSILLPQYSRTLLQSWIKSGYVAVDSKIILLPRTLIAQHAEAGEESATTVTTITINAVITTIKEHATPQAIALDIIYADDDIIVVNKPVGLIVHPGAGCKDGTLLNALLHYAPELANLPRAGIVHRLDKDTSGLLVIARNLTAHKKLVDAFTQHAKGITREYEAIVYGTIIAGGTINAPIGRHRTRRTMMAVVGESNDNDESDESDEHDEETSADSVMPKRGRGRHAVTHYRVIQRFPHHAHLRVILETGRTHQIRVHMAHIDHPIVGDQTYGGRLKLPRHASPELLQALSNFKHQALHAAKLTLTHPRTGKTIEFSAPLPQDMQKLLQALQIG